MTTEMRACRFLKKGDGVGGGPESSSPGGDAVTGGAGTSVGGAASSIEEGGVASRSLQIRAPMLQTPQMWELACSQPPPSPSLRVQRWKLNKKKNVHKMNEYANKEICKLYLRSCE